MIRYLATFVVFLAACTPAVNPPAPDGSSPSVPQPVPANLTPDCNGMCSVLASYGCPEATGVEGGDSCVVTCTRVQGGMFDLHPDCIVSNAASLAGIRSCGTVTCTGATGVRRMVR